MPRVLTIKGAHNRAWKACSLYIRTRDHGKCYTCTTQKDITQMEAGHYYHSGNSHPETEYDERNLHCQCYACNRMKSGNRDIYALRLEEQYGHGILQELYQLRYKAKKWTIEELLEIENIYKQKYLQLIN